MDLKHLQTFVATAEFQNFTRAAESLRVTQAAVSQHIAALEKELSVSLFQRTGRSVKLTDQGSTLYEYANRIVNMVDEAKTAVGSSTANVKGSVRIACSTVPSESILPEILIRLRDRFPDVHPSVFVSDSEQALDAVIHDRADFGLVGEMPRSSQLAATAIATDEMMLIVASDHSWAKKKSIKLSQFLKMSLIIREPGSGSRRCVEQVLEAAGVVASDLNVIMEMNSNDAICQAVERGLGAALLSKLVLRDRIAQGRVSPLNISGISIQRQLYAVTRKNRLAPPAVRALRSCLDEARQ